ncbi:hypothetical protein GCM10009837_07180 [Streptomyces durmitorensis]|uniref:Uncharacterized protein n=1 Tax=Streptomyces durmitorensis TaxID=319947 RepID=A0ABY4PMM9_9ACTN|nr:hypothetical protein [Streptomyces durmitorensis]UQT54389.1 hypothetical protein M4V62_04400 [Streptomyces durmitorensis]
MPQPAWPEDVVARYLTLSGEIFRDPSMYVEVLRKDGQHSVARCRCCTYDTSRQHDGRAQDMAQAHAETCRALPKPTA